MIDSITWGLEPSNDVFYSLTLGLNMAPLPPSVGLVDLTARPRDFSLTARERDFSLTARERPQ